MFFNQTAIDVARENGHFGIVGILTGTKLSSNDKPVEVIDLEKQNKQLTQQITALQKQNQLYLQYIKALQAKDRSPAIPLNEIKDEELVIGTGSSSIVKSAYKDFQVYYAKKEYKAYFDEKDHQRQKRQFQRETEILKKLDHPCIIKMIGQFPGDKKQPPFIYLQQGKITLEDAIKQNELSNLQKNMIIAEIVLGLRYIHSKATGKEIIHRDLRPSNIILDENYHAYIADFDTAQYSDDENPENVPFGYQEYHAPELFTSTPPVYSEKTDIFAFGLLLVLIISGEEYPFDPKDRVEGRILGFSEYILPWSKDLILRCLEYDPEYRPTFAECFEIMKLYDHDFFGSTNPDDAPSIEKEEEIQAVKNRILEIQAIEFRPE